MRVFMAMRRFAKVDGSRRGFGAALAALALGALALGFVVTSARAQIGSTANSVGSQGASWYFGNTNGVLGSVDDGEAINTIRGFGLDDASLQGIGPALFSSATLWINTNNQFETDDFGVLNGILSTSPKFTESVTITVQHSAVINAPLLRSLITFENPGPGSVTLNRIDWVFAEAGGDENATRATSSGDLIFNVDDRWTVSSDIDDEFTVPSVPVLLYGLYGTGAISETTTSTAFQVYAVGNVSPLTRRGMRATFETITIPAGSARRLLFFTGMYRTNATAIAAANEFADFTGCAFAGLSPTQRAEIVNWHFPAGNATCDLFLPSLRK